MIKSKDTKHFWNKVAEETSLSDKGFVGMLTDGNEFNAIYRQSEEEAHFLRIFEPTQAMDVLEVGSGGGRWSLFLADKVRMVTGIDFSENMIRLAEQQRQSKGVDNVRFVQSDLLSFGEQQQFDLIYFSGVLQYLDDDDVVDTVRKAKQLLKPGGVILSRDTIQERKRIVLQSGYPVIYRTIKEYAALFETNDLKLDYCELSYPPRRFSHFAARLYALPFVNYAMAKAVQSVLIGVNSLLGNPRFLMKKHYRLMLDEAGDRQHRFFRYTPI